MTEFDRFDHNARARGILIDTNLIVLLGGSEFTQPEPRLASQTILSEGSGLSRKRWRFRKIASALRLGLSCLFDRQTLTCDIEFRTKGDKAVVFPFNDRGHTLRCLLPQVYSDSESRYRLARQTRSGPSGTSSIKPASAVASGFGVDKALPSSMSPASRRQENRGPRDRHFAGRARDVENQPYLCRSLPAWCFPANCWKTTAAEASSRLET